VSYCAGFSVLKHQEKIAIPTSAHFGERSFLAVQITTAVFGSPLRGSRVLSGMNGLDAPYYRAEAKRCQESAAQARDPATKEYWLNSERCWLKLANQAELVAANAHPKSRLRPTVNGDTE
jgi:hypothetical protein